MKKAAMALVNLPAGTGEMRAKSAPNISPRAAVVVATAAVASLLG